LEHIPCNMINNEGETGDGGGNNGKAFAENLARFVKPLRAEKPAENDVHTVNGILALLNDQPEHGQSSTLTQIAEGNKSRIKAATASKPAAQTASTTRR